MSLKVKIVFSEAETIKLLVDLYKLTVNHRQLQSVAEAAAQQKIAHLEDNYVKILRKLKARVDDDAKSELSMIGKVDSTFTRSRIGVDISDSERIRHISFGSCRLLFRDILPSWAARVPSSRCEYVSPIEFLHESARKQVFGYFFSTRQGVRWSFSRTV